MDKPEVKYWVWEYDRSVQPITFIRHYYVTETEAAIHLLGGAYMDLYPCISSNYYSRISLSESKCRKGSPCSICGGVGYTKRIKLILNGGENER